MENCIHGPRVQGSAAHEIWSVDDVEFVETAAAVASGPAEAFLEEDNEAEITGDEEEA